MRAASARSADVKNSTYCSGWLHHRGFRTLLNFTAECPNHGYRNLGKRPIDTINAYLETVRQEA